MEKELLDKLADLGVDKAEISTDDLRKMMQGKTSDMLNFTVPDNKTIRDFLDKENVDYTVKDGKIMFSGKVRQETVYEAENNEKNRKILDDAKINYETVPEKNRLRWFASNAAIFAIGAINPIIGAIAFTYNTLHLIAKKRQIDNAFDLAHPEMHNLKKGEIIQGTDRQGNAVIRQLDKETNTIMTARVDSIKVPDKIFETNLSDKQKQMLRNGLAITVKNEKGKDIKVKIDLTNETGLTKIGAGNKMVKSENIGFKM